MIDGPCAKAVVLSGETFFAALFDRLLSFRPQQVITQQRNERHGHYSRRDQRTNEHYRKRVEKLTHRSPEHQEGKISEDIGDRCVNDCFRELRWAMPGGLRSFVSQRQV